ncbi:MAG: FhaA domain-containing protein [Mycobacterium sp.]
MDSQRGLVQRIERKLESAVEDAMARVFGGEVVPEEVEAALRREAADGVRAVAGNQLLAPNEYVITLGVDDYDNVGADQDLTSKAFARHLAGHIGEQGWQTYGDVVVRFEQSPSLRTGQVRTRGAVNPEASPYQTVSESRPSQSDHAFTAESGVPPMTDNPSYRGAHGQDRPGDDYYDPRHGRPADDARGGQESRGSHYAPEPEPYQQDPYQQDPRGGYPDQGQQGGPGGYVPPPRPEQGGYPDQGGYSEPGGYPGGQGGYPQSYEPRPSYPDQGGYGAPSGYDQGYPQQPPPAPAYPAGGGQPGYGDYERPRQDSYAYPEAQPEQRPAYPDQGGPAYPDQGAPSYGRQDYAQPDYRYGDAQGAPAGYDYGQPPAPAGYGQRAYSAPASVTLQLDDGSGRTYQLHEGANVVGRGQDAQFRLPDTGVSRRHLEIRWDGRVALLSDLNSTNGTTVNNAPVQEWQLADGDVIRLGHSEIIVRVH